MVGPDSVVEALNRSGESASSGSSNSRGTARLARESALSLGSTMVAGSLNLILPVVVTRQLAEADAGIYFQAVALFMVLLQVGVLGADTGVLRSLPRALATGEPEAVPVYVRTATLIPAAWATLVGLLLAVAAPTVAELMLHGAPEHEPTLTSCLYIVAGLLPVAVTYLVMMSATRGLHSIRMLVLVDKIGKGALQLVLVAGSVLVVDSVTSAVAGWTVAYAVCLVVVCMWFVSYSRRRRPTGRWAPMTRSRRQSLVRPFWRFCLPRAVAGVCNVAMQRIDIVLVGGLLGPADAALYAAATRFVVLGTLLGQAIQQVMAPKISEAIALEELSTAHSIYRTTTAWLTLLAWPVYLLATNFAVLLLGVFGDSYRTAWPAVVILCLTMLIATACGPVDMVLLMAGRSGLSLVNVVAALIVMLVVDIVLIPHLGVSGAAIGWSSALALKNLLALAQVRANLSMHPFGPAFATAAVIAIVCYGMIPFITAQVGGISVRSLIVSLVLGIVSSSVLITRNLTVLGLDSARRLWPRRRN